MVIHIRTREKIQVTPDEVAKAESVVWAGAVTQWRIMLAEANLLLNLMQLGALRLAADRLDLEELGPENRLFAFGERCDWLCMRVVELSKRLGLEHFYQGEEPGEENAIQLDADDLYLVRDIVTFLYPPPANVFIAQVLNAGAPDTLLQRWTNLVLRIKTMDTVAPR